MGAIAEEQVEIFQTGSERRSHPITSRQRQLTVAHSTAVETAETGPHYRRVRLMLGIKPSKLNK